MRAERLQCASQNSFGDEESSVSIFYPERKTCHLLYVPTKPKQPCVRD